PPVPTLFPYTTLFRSVDAVLGDLLDPEAVRAAIRGCDAVMHLAAVADVNVVVADPTHAEAVNAGGTQTLLEAAREAVVSRFAYRSEEHTSELQSPCNL